MVDINYKKIIRVIAIALTLFVSVFVVTGVSAQSINAVEVDNDPVIQITARVLGCGDNIVHPLLGEQCDGLDLNNQSCETLGFDSGALSCRNSCIFETSLCINNSNSGSGFVRDVGDIFNNNPPDTNVVFTGQGEPNSTFFVTTFDGIFTKVKIGSDGTFSITVSEPVPGDYNFTFYTLSPNGLFGPKTFSTPIQQYATTYINNIFIPYKIEEEIIEPIVPVDEVDPTLPLNPNPNPNPNLGTGDQNIDGDLYKQFLDILAQSENLSPDELRDLIKIFSEQNGYEAQVPGYSKEGLKLGLLPYLQRQWSKLPDVGRRWYPNVYTSFLEPYRILFYEGTNWFSERNNPITRSIVNPIAVDTIIDTGRKWYPNVYVSFLEPYRTIFYESTNWFREPNNPVTSWLYK